MTTARSRKRFTGINTKGGNHMRTQEGTNQVIETMEHFMRLARGRKDLSKLKQDTIITWLRRRYAETHPDDYAEYQRRFGTVTHITTDQTTYTVKHPTGDYFTIIKSRRNKVDNPPRIEYMRDGIKHVDCLKASEVERHVNLIMYQDWLTGDEQAFLIKNLLGVTA